MAKILVVEDNPDYQELLINFLGNSGHSVTGVSEGATALDLLDETSFDLILLDLMLPKMDGYRVCQEIRRTGQTPIIMLTALDSELNQMKGYNLQIDDYITKPVSMPLLVQKVEAVLRRTLQPEPEILSVRDIQLNPKTHTVTIGQTSVEFTLREFEILHELMKNPGEVVTRKALLSRLWGYNFYGDARIVDTHIKNIRRKLSEHDCIDTVRGVGYKLK